jgi:hypothetical protein
MTSHDTLDRRLRELTEARFKDYGDAVLRSQAAKERDARVRGAREKRYRDFMASLGLDLAKFDAGLEKDNRAQEAELKSFLAEHRDKSVHRPSHRAADARMAALQSELLAASGHTVLPPVASSLFVPNTKVLTNWGGTDWVQGPIESGWVMPDDPSVIKIKYCVHAPDGVCWEADAGSDPEFATNFTFTPATTGTYQMTAVLAFHGFYILRSDDSWWNCRYARVGLTAQTNANQYEDFGWKDYPALLDVEKDNAEERTNFDRSFFFDYTAPLRGGDPVIFTAKGALDADAHGGGAYAELNFYDGTANYIQPLFLWVQKV